MQTLLTIIGAICMLLLYIWGIALISFIVAQKDK